MIRSLTLPPAVPGQLYLRSMPGRYEPFEKARKEIVQRRIAWVICLAPLEEVRSKSPVYARAIEAGEVPWADEMFPIPDYGVPADRDAFLDLVRTIAERLRARERVLIHCGAGIGRTGTLAVCVLRALGMTQDEAYEAVTDAGSGPETSAQEELVQWVADRLGLS